MILIMLTIHNFESENCKKVVIKQKYNYICHIILNMETQRKIKLDHFANTRLKKDQTISHDEKTFYPLYLDIVHRRQHIQIKSAISNYYTEDMKNVNRTDLKLMGIEKDIVIRIIRFEEKHFGDNYKLKGIGNRYTNYTASIYYTINNLQRVKIKNAIESSRSEYFKLLNFDREDLSAEKLYKASLILVDDLDEYIDVNNFNQELAIWQEYFTIYHREKTGVFKFPMFLDWLEDGHNETFRRHLIKGEKFNTDVINKNLDHINSIIRLATIEQ